MRNFQDTFETRKRSYISAFPVCMTVPLKHPFQIFQNEEKYLLTQTLDTENHFLG